MKSMLVVVVLALGFVLLFSGSAQTAVENAEKDRQELGTKIYEQYCLSCHQVDGSGVPYTYPPIGRTDWVNGDADYLIRMLLNGISGPFYVNGELYNDEMPAYDYLPDEEIAAVLTYIRQNFGNEADPVSAERVEAIRQEESSR